MKSHSSPRSHFCNVLYQRGHHDHEMEGICVNITVHISGFRSRQWLSICRTFHVWLAIHCHVWNHHRCPEMFTLPQVPTELVWVQRSPGQAVFPHTRWLNLCPNWFSPYSIEPITSEKKLKALKPLILLTAQWWPTTPVLRKCTAPTWIQDSCLRFFLILLNAMD